MTVFAALNRFARAASKRSDIVIAAFMLLAIIMMVIPLPTFLVDVLIGMNIAFSLLIFVVAFYISQPVQFSALPSIILLGTLFRLFTCHHNDPSDPVAGRRRTNCVGLR